MPRLSKIITKKHKIAEKEASVSGFIPYTCHWNSTTILTKKKEFMSVIKVKGFSFETADDEDLDIKKEVRNNLLKGMSGGSFALWFHTFRRKSASYPDGEFNNTFAQSLDDKWRLKHHPDYTFANEHYITVIRRNSAKGAMLFEHLLKKLQHSTDQSAAERDLLESYSELEEIKERVMNALANYKPQLLGTVETPDGYFSELLEFLGMIVNCGSHQKMLVPTMDISHYISNHRLYFSDKAIEVKGPNKTNFAGIVSVKEYRPATHPGMLDGFLNLPFEFIISQSYTFTDRMFAISKMQLQQRRLVQSQDVAVSQIAEIDEALDSAMGGAFGFGDHHLTIMCIEDSIKSLETALSQAVVEFANIGVNAVRERMNMEPAFWAQLPSNIDYIVRKSTINTLNLASFASLHNFPSGKPKGNHWGNAVTVFNTTSGTPYFFSFHVRDVGHTMIIGPTGAGKTVLMNFLCAQAQKFKPRMFFFDKDRGAEIFIRAIGGKYSIIDPARDSGFNPLQLPDNNENRSFLIEWISTLVTTNGEKISAEDMAKITDAIDGNYRIPHEQRKLSNIAPFLGMETPGSLANRLKMWHSGGSRARIFDNDTDVVDFESAASFGFEMAELLRDKISLSSVLLYLFHRIGMSLDGTPTMIVLDEAWALIDNPVFGPKIKDWLKVLRKLNAFVIFATQSVEDAAKSAISDTLVQQTATQIFLPNLKATPVYRDVFMLSDREYTLVKTTDPGSRFFLVKQDNDGVVARIDLSGMSDVVSVLSGKAETVILLDSIIEEYGENPDDWLPIYIQKVREL